MADLCISRVIDLSYYYLLKNGMHRIQLITVHGWRWRGSAVNPSRQPYFVMGATHPDYQMRGANRVDYPPIVALENLPKFVQLNDATFRIIPVSFDQAPSGFFTQNYVLTTEKALSPFRLRTGDIQSLNMVSRKGELPWRVDILHKIYDLVRTQSVDNVHLGCYKIHVDE